MPADPVLSEVLERCRRDHRAWINGDGSHYWLPDDGTILGAVGGFGGGGPETAERQRAVAAQWRRGSGTIELINGGAVHRHADPLVEPRGLAEVTSLLE